MQILCSTQSDPSTHSSSHDGCDTCAAQFAQSAAPIDSMQTACSGEWTAAPVQHCLLTSCVSCDKTACFGTTQPLKVLSLWNCVSRKKKDFSKISPDLRRPLAPGRYVVTASHPGMANASATVTVPPNGSGVVITFRLAPADSARKVRSDSTSPSWPVDRACITSI